MKKKYKYDCLVATIKDWNIQAFERLAKDSDLNLKLISIPKDLNIEKIDKINPRYIFFPHWSWIIPEEIYAGYECIVFHMTNLPYGRGGSPLQNLILRGAKNTKISALRVVKDLDAGPIYFKRSLSLNGSAQQIYERASEIIFNDMIPHIITNKPKPKPQRGKAVYFKRRKPEQSSIKPLDNIFSIYDHIRMLDAEGYPKAFLEAGNFHFEFFQASIKDGIMESKVQITQKEGKLDAKT